MLKEIKKIDKSAEILVVTPLSPNHKISKETKKTIKRSKVPFNWVSYTGDNNIPTNAEKGLVMFTRKYYKPKYFLMIDNDIIAERNLIDKMYNCLSNNRDPRIAYTYASFKFDGYINIMFSALPFDHRKLCKSNYISSNSMIKVEALDKIGGFVKDNKYVRLLDWCLWLKFMSYGYIGQPCPDAFFIAISDEKSVSSGSNEDYWKKFNEVQKDFVEPHKEKWPYLR